MQSYGAVLLCNSLPNGRGLPNLRTSLKSEGSPVVTNTARMGNAGDKVAKGKVVPSNRRTFPCCVFFFSNSPFHIANLSLLTVITNTNEQRKKYLLYRSCKLLAMEQKLRSAHCKNVSTMQCPLQWHEETLTFSLAITVASNPLSQGVIVVEQRCVSMVMVVRERTTCLLLCHWPDASSCGGQAELRLVRRCSSQRRVRHDSSLKTGNTGL